MHAVLVHMYSVSNVHGSCWNPLALKLREGCHIILKCNYSHNIMGDKLLLNFGVKLQKIAVAPGL